MDAVLALALLSFGMFVGVCVTALVYVSAIRPGLLESADAEESVSRQAVGRTQSGGALETGQPRTEAQEEYLIELAQRIEEHLNAQTRQIDDMTLQLNAELHSQDETLGSIITLLDTQTSILTNAHAILRDWQSPQDLAALAGRFTDLSEQVNTLADTLMNQDERVRQVHAHVVSDEPLFALMGKQGAELNALAGKLQAFDEKLGLVDRGAPELSSLNQEVESYTVTLADLKKQIAEQESHISEILENFTADRSLTAISAALHQQAQQIGKMDARLEEQAKTLEQQTDDQRGLLRSVSRQLGELVPDIDVISKRKTRVIRLPHRLTDIKGIGPVYAGLLHEAGVQTFQQLAQFTPDELRALVDVPRWRTINAESWIEQAKTIVAREEKLEENR